MGVMGDILFDCRLADRSFVDAVSRQLRAVGVDCSDFYRRRCKMRQKISPDPDILGGIILAVTIAVLAPVCAVVLWFFARSLS